MMRLTPDEIKAAYFSRMDHVTGECPDDHNQALQDVADAATRKALEVILQQTLPGLSIGEKIDPLIHPILNIARESARSQIERVRQAIIKEAGLV